MSAGDKIHRDGQYEFSPAFGDHSVLFNGDDFPVVMMHKVDGLFGFPDKRGTDYERQGGDGFVPSTSFYGGRILTGDFTIMAADEYQMHQAIMDVTEVLQIDNDGDGMLVFQKPRVGRRVIFCRPDKLSMPTGYEVVRGLNAKGVVQFVAHDPRIYSLYENQVTIEVPPGETSGSATVHMGGNWKRGVPCTIALNGPGVNPRIANAAHFNRQIKIVDGMGSGDVLVMHTGNLTVEDFPAGTDQSTLLADDSQWWHLQKGDNVITVNRDSSAGTMTAVVTWRDAYTL